MLTEKSVGNSNNFYPVNSYSVNKLKKFLRIFYLLDRLPNLSLVKLHLRLIFIACASHVTVAWAWRERCSWAVSSRFSGMRDLPWERGRFWTVKTSRTQNWETKDSFCSGDTWPDPNLSRSVGTGRRSDPWQQGWIQSHPELQIWINSRFLGNCPPAPSALREWSKIWVVTTRGRRGYSGTLVLGLYRKKRATKYILSEI